ncbi:MAG: AAA family ATPase [Leptospiraceae bacterium]|nr:AAA family ATPase [Leptospiraceae bacterium]
MIPVSLKFSGFASYQSETQIEFQTLTRSGLFGIFGSVGSGKSSIIEAISFAIYGEIDKLGSSDKNYNSMNLKSNKCFIELIAEIDGETYKFYAAYRRNQKSFHKVESTLRQIHKLIKDNWEVEIRSPEEILGLNYQNFKRAVILPQGKFQEFLTLTPKERSQMLMDLFHLERFDLTEKVKTKIDQNEKELSYIEGELSGLVEVSEESLEADKNSLVNLEAELQDLQNKINFNRDEIIKTSKELDQWNHFLQKKYELNELNLEKEKRDSRKEILMKFKEITKTDTLNNFGIYQSESKNYEKFMLNLLEKEKLFEEKNLKKQEFEKKIQQIQNKLLEENIEDELNIKKNILDGAKIHKEKIEIILEKSNIENLISKTNQELFQQKKTLEDLDSISIKLENSLLEYDKLSDVNSNLSNYKEKETRIQNVRNKILEIEVNIKSLEKEKNFIRLELVALEPKFIDISSECITLSNKKMQIEKDLEEKQKESILIELSSSLIEGNACPICGSLDHPVPFTIAHVSLDELKLAKKDIEASIMKFFNNRNSYKSKAEMIEAKLSMLNEEKYHLNQLEVQNHSFLEELKSLGFEIETFELRYSELKESRQERIKLESKKQRLRETISSLQDRLISEKNLLNNFDKEISILEGRAQEILKLIPKDYTIDFSSIDINSYQKDLDRVSNQLYNMKTELETFMKEKIEIDKLVQNISGNIETLRHEVNNSLNIKNESWRKIKIIIDSVNISEIELVEFYNKRSDFENELSEEKIFFNKYNILKDEIQKFEKELPKETNLVDKSDRLKKDQIELDKVFKSNNELKGALEQRVKNQSLNLLNRNRLNEKKSILKQRKEGLEILSKLFKGKEFVNYVSRLYLNQICESANERFRKFTNRSLELELDEDNNFWVRDILNGGKLRSVKTLSGGQIFQASLALSLSLADSITLANQRRENFFFLDEGFGSLDKDSLRIVLDSLKSLRKENRIVGIISHVEELKNEINTYLKVELTHDGSKVSLNF